MLDDLIKLIRGHRRQRVEEEKVAPGLAARVKLLEAENRDLSLALDGLYERERTLRRALTKLDERYQELRHGCEELTLQLRMGETAGDAEWTRSRLRDLLTRTMITQMTTQTTKDES